jgi:hypothetical protein
MASPRHGLTDLAASQAVPETTVNENLRILEQMGNAAIVADRLTAPPGSPVDGTTYLIIATATGAWAAKEDQLALRVGTSWKYITPIEGTRAYVQDENVWYQYGGASWAVDTVDISGSDLDDLADVNAPSPADGDALVWDNGAGEWVPAPMPGGGSGGTVPDGGTTGQVLTKQSGVDQDTDWETPAVPYVIQRLWMTPDGLLKTFNVNSTTYINALIPFEHYLDRDVFPATHFRILISGQSNAVGATVTVQLADWGAPTTGLHTGGNDLVITNTLSAFDSGWLAYNDASVGFRHNTLACKGSNATVDLSIFFAEIHYKIA